MDQKSIRRREPNVTAIYSSIALKNRQREVKDAALNEIVHITENGNGAFVFCSEEIFEQTIQAAREEAAYEERLAAALGRADADLEAGRVYTSVEEAREAGIARRRQRG